MKDVWVAVSAISSALIDICLILSHPDISFSLDSEFPTYKHQIGVCRSQLIIERAEERNNLIDEERRVLSVGESGLTVPGCSAPQWRRFWRGDDSGLSGLKTDSCHWESGHHSEISSSQMGQREEER